jgi:hypothetical protein
MPGAEHVVIVMTPGTPERLEVDCTACGWADVWQVRVYSLSPHGVTCRGVVRRCQRCKAAQ